MQPQMNTSSAVPITSTAGRKPKNCTCAKRDSLSIALFIVYCGFAMSFHQEFMLPI